MSGQLHRFSRDKLSYRLTLLFLLAVMAVVLAACGNDSTENSRPTTTSTDRVATTDDRRATTTTTLPPASTTSTTSDVTTTLGDISIIPVGGGVGTIGVVGCSNTDQSVSGYAKVSSSHQLVEGDLGGGTISAWGDPADSGYPEYWGYYDQRRPSEGYDGTWVQLCIRTNEHTGTFAETHQAWVSHIVEEIHRRDPGIPVWVSPLNFYEGIVCDAVGPEGPAVAADTSDWAAANLAEVARGPNLGPLLPEHMGQRDNCHPSDAGERFLGEQLVAFFD